MVRRPSCPVAPKTAMVMIAPYCAARAARMDGVWRAQNVLGSECVGAEPHDGDEQRERQQYDVHDDRLRFATTAVDHRGKHHGYG